MSRKIRSPSQMTLSVLEHQFAPDFIYGTSKTAPLSWRAVCLMETGYGSLPCDSRSGKHFLATPETRHGTMSSFNKKMPTSDVGILNLGQGQRVDIQRKVPVQYHVPPELCWAPNPTRVLRPMRKTRCPGDRSQAAMAPTGSS